MLHNRFDNRNGEGGRALHKKGWPKALPFSLVVPNYPDILQDARLNYVEQHAERIGLDSGRLENMRVAASKSSPMADTLDLAARHADIASLDALVPALCQLLKRGVGVNTRVGSARFVANLAARMGSDIRPQTGTLLKV